MTKPIADSEARSTALDYRRSFCIQAPAGSGKTELLTQRILNLLAHCEQPEEVLAFTFTRKAAAEMRNRLLSSLEAAEKFDKTQLSTLQAHKQRTMALALAVLERDAELGWKLLQNSQRLRITTIDGFTAWLTSRLPLASGFGSRPQISTDMQQIFEQAVRQTINYLNDDGETSDQVARLIQHLHGNLGQCETLLMELLYKRDQWLPLVTSLRANPDQARAYLEQNLQHLLDELCAEAAMRLQPFENELMSLVQFSSAQRALNDDPSLEQLEFTNELPEGEAMAAPQWQAIAKLMLTANAADFRKRVDKRVGFPGKSSTKDKALAAQFVAMQTLFASTAQNLSDDALLPLLQRLTGLPPQHYSDKQWDVLEDLVKLLPLLAAQLNTAMSTQGVIDHTQTSLASLAALGSETEPTDLALLLDYRIKHILVDEFQDTSSMQFLLLRLLTAGWSSEDGRTLFIVGDGMQSCYSFRNANVGLFLRARENVGNVAMELLQLEVNFRSTPQVVDWVNTVFSAAFPMEDDIARGGVSYSPSTTSDHDMQSDGVSAHLFLQAEDGTESSIRRRVEAEAVADYCQALQQAHPNDSIAILVRNRGNLDQLVPALRRLNLKWNAEDIDPLLSYPPINDLFTLLRALLNLADITSWLALLRCPFIGIALVDLELIASYRKEQTCSVFTAVQQFDAINGLSEDAQMRLRRVTEVLQTARGLLQRRPLAELLENLWIELGGAACLEDKGLYDNIDDFFRLLDSASLHGDIDDIHHFEKQLKACYGSTKEKNVQLQIMTIHKAKGLEFDHVLLPCLDRKVRSNTSSLLRWQEYVTQEQQTLALLGLLASKGDGDDPLYSYLKKEASLREGLETTRLMYIAITRAIKTARLFGSVVQKKDRLAGDANSLLETIIAPLLEQAATLKVQIEALPEELTTIPASQGKAETQTFKRLAKQWAYSAGENLLLSPLEADPLEPTHDPLAAAIGELVHLGLQQIVQQGKATISELYPALWHSKLRPLCPDKALLEESLSKVKQQLETCVNSPDAAWLFSQQHQDDHCELALMDYSSGYRKDYSIDRTFIDSQQVRWIIDYKSSTPAAGQSIDNFLEEQTLRYSEQLKCYRKLMQHQGKEAIKTALFFTALPLLHEIKL